MNEILRRQLALDYCCAGGQLPERGNIFHVYRPLEGRRRFCEKEPCHLKIAAADGRLLFAGEEDILAWCRARYADRGPEWFFEAKELRALDERLRADGFRIGTAHPFYIAETQTAADPGPFEIRWYHGAEIEAFRGDGRFREAFCFCPEAPDMIGAAALRGGEIVGMAGASADSPTMWQIGIDVDPACRGEGVGTLLVTLLKNEILRRGILPFYGTSTSHIASQRVALAAGFLPAWAELVTERIEGEDGA